MEKIKVVINGFGRIGRNLAKILIDHDRIELVQVNDIIPALDNLVYLYNYDSTYGKPLKKAKIVENNSLFTIGEQIIHFTHVEDFLEVEWKADYVIDATGIKCNILKAKESVSAGKIKKCIMTNSPVEDIDKVFIMGVNHEEYDEKNHNVIGSSICDANAISHFIKWAGNNYGIENAFVTTLHPWLSYQNLVDGPVHSVSSPTHFWKDYSLGRSSVSSLIPKSTTAVQATLQVLPEYEGKIDAISYRTPTGIVSSADITMYLSKEVDEAELMKKLEEFVESNKYLKLNTDSLISMDYIGESASGILDHQWTKLLNGKMLKMIVWYDNEWGYSNRAVDLLEYIAEK
jgi:glyceraldehyde 3-phosphate dehydrogenase